MGATTLLAVEALEVAFATPAGPLHAVRGLDLALARGDTLALVGESGSGKSVTALALLGLLPATARAHGRVLWEGTDLLPLPERERRRWRGRRLGLVMQDALAALNPVLTVGEQVAEGLRHHGGLGRRAAARGAVRLLEEVRLPDAAAVARLHPHRLSGGMRQRALLATALACGPELLIADEPTASLDATVQAQVLDVIAAAVAARGMALVFITHHLALVPRVARRVAVMYAGRLVETGPAGAVLATPRHPYTRALLASLPERWPPGTPPPGPAGPPPDPRRPAPGCAYAPRCTHARDACRARAPAWFDAGEGWRAACLPEVAGAPPPGEART